MAQGMTDNNCHVSLEFVEAVLDGHALGDPSMLAFRDPETFVAGYLHNCLPAWERISKCAPFELTPKILHWIKNCVDIHEFFRPFKGQYKGENFDSGFPPRKTFPNAISCKPFSKFISDTIIARLASGAISLWGKVGHVDPPYLVLPLTVEETKPRLCNDNRFLNLWIKDTPFKLDSLSSLPRYVTPSSFQSVCDDKSGYDHVLLCPESRTYFGFQWGGWFFTSNTLPFGWKSSAYIYHSIGLLASHYFRSVLIPCSLYIDDRHTGEIQLSIKAPAYAPLSSQREKSLARASSAIFIVCHTLISLGYFLGLKKSILTPRQVVPYLGFLVDSVRQAFLLIQEKKQKCLSLTRHVLSRSSTDVKTLQRLSGKYMSFALAVPGARLFINELNIAIAKGLRSSRPISVSGSLKDEIQHWLFLESWTGYLPWRQELHHQVKLCSDASSFAWACTLGPNAHDAMIRDYWPADQRGLHINVKETLALVNALEALSFRDSWVDVFTDSQVLIRSWQSQGAKSHALSNALKKLFWVVSKTNIHLNLCYIPSPLNPADPPSRVLSLQDAKLSPSAWSQVQVKFGGRLGHSADLMALPSNVQCSLDGSPLPFFSPYPTPGCSGVNVFAQLPANHGHLFSNPYIFPPIVLIPQVLRFAKTQSIPCSLVVPDVRPRKFWWPLLQSFPSFLLAPRGTPDIVCSPSPHGFSSSWPLPWDLWVFRIVLP